MATITGTSGPDSLVGTMGDDLIASGGTSMADDWDVMIGLDGADTYQLYDLTGGGTVKNFRISDQGTDGARDAITGAGAMYHSASLGYSAWAHASRLGDTLSIHLPGKPYRFHDPAQPEYNIRITDHFAGQAVESLTAGGVTYQLATGSEGSAQADIIAGGAADDVFTAFGGDDFVFGNKGNDRLDLGAGDDTAFGGKGRDTILAGAGDDHVFGGRQRDFLYGGDGNDTLEGEAGRDRIRGEDGNDWLLGGARNDWLHGGNGDDRLDGGTGNDKLIGGRGADLYRVDTNNAPGHDTIRERGDTASWSLHDTIELAGLYGPSELSSPAEAYAALRFERAGTDMELFIADSTEAQVTVLGMFDAAHHDRNFVEKLSLNGGYWSPLEFRFLDGAVTKIGDDRTIFLTYGAKLNEVLFGGAGDDQIFGGTGTNFIWTGAGADTLIYKVGDGASFGGLGGAVSSDIVEDFDPARDRFDFTEVANDIGATFADLVIGEQADGDATIFLATGNWEVADIMIELRGVSAAQVTEDLFAF